MKVLITGAGGFLGLNIARKLLKQNHQVFNFSRSHHLIHKKLGITHIPGDIKNINEITAALKNKDAVIHTASKVSMWGRWDDFYSTNVLGTKNIIDACEQHRITKLIYTSSPSVVFGGGDLCGLDEEIKYPAKYLNHYAHTKAMAEKLVLNANSPNLCTTALRPHLIFGADDPHMIPRLCHLARQKKLKIIGEGDNQVDVIHVGNAADAHLLALERLEKGSPVCGQSYFLGQEKPVLLWDFINQILKYFKIAPVHKKISFNTAYCLGSVLEKSYQLLQRYESEPAMTRFVACQLSKSHYFDHSRAKRDFGFYPTISTSDGIKTI